MKRLLLLLLLIALAFDWAWAGEARLLRFPDVNVGKITFVYGGDIYIVDRGGGHATRLTSHEGLELFPKFSPDGKMIAFSGQYDGDMSVYVMPISGGEPKRLTFHPGIQKTSERFGPENVVMGWHPGGSKVLFRSRKESNDWWTGRVYLVDIRGGLPVPLPMASAGLTSYSPDAGKVAYCPIYRDFRTWKRYKGGMAQDVWTFDLTTLEARKITDWVGTDNMPMWFENRIYFNSDRTGKLNLYCYELESGQIRQVTRFTEYDVRWPSIGPDAIAFENAGFIYVLDLPSEDLHKVSVSLTSDRHTMRDEYVSVSDKIREFDLSPDGKRAVFSARDDIFTVPARKGNTRSLAESSGSKEKYPTWSPDGRWIAFVSDSTGEQEIYVMSHDGKQKIRLTADGACYRYELFWSPDSRKLAFSDKDLKLYYLDVDSKESVQFDHTPHTMVRHFSWSPDSRYIAYAKDDEVEISAVYVYSLAEDTIYQVTPGFTHDTAPVFDPDGKYLYFLSQRNFNPLLSRYEFEFVNKAITNLYLIVLSADEQSPFAPESDEVNPEKEQKESDREKKTEEEVTAETKIDFAGIYGRQVAFDLPAGNYGGLNAISGAVFYFADMLYGLRGKVLPGERILRKYNLKEKKDYKFASGISSCKMAASGDRMLLKKGKDFYIAGTAGEEAELKDSKLDLSGMQMRLDRVAEYAQMMDETRRLFRDFFYDENMHGVDWQQTYERYAALLPYVVHRYDLTYLLGEMVGELCCSHTYVGGGEYPKPPSSNIGLLGVDFDVDRQHNRIKIARILRGQNWDKALRSPLLDPGIAVSAGDYLLAINGREITADVNPYELTQNTVGKTITLTVNSKPEWEGAREVTVKPIASEEALRYHNWVEDRREYVDSVSGGTIGYIHIPDMGGFGLVQFNKMFYHQVRKQGLILDVRYNGGGFVSSLVMDRLTKKIIAMGASRNFAYGPNPHTGINAHMVTLQNEFSCSDGDIFSYRFRFHKLGPLMGKRTWGGVVGFDKVHKLSDGGYIIVSEGAMYDFNGKWVMENIGVEPDIEVDNPPDRTALGFDDQLIAAIDYLKRKIAEEPRILPGPPEPPAER
ncbi:MAG: PD40 domain-containing protein [Candidatus Zixiibacteriota bacterium]|nr:MAG: PD40 domain-containing protein [candidate division Zixibacteria bacterium]